MSFPCVRFLQQRQDKILDFSKHIEDKFMIQNIELNNSNNNIIDELHASQQHINKFSMENCCRDVSTGSFLSYRFFNVRKYIIREFIFIFFQ